MTTLIANSNTMSDTEILTNIVAPVSAKADEMPVAPVETGVWDNDNEVTFSFKTIDGYAIDLCTINDTPGELIINVSDEVGNQITGVVISPEIIQDYLNRLTQA